MIRFKHILLLLVLSSCYVSDEVAPDQEIWEYARPGEVGLLENTLLDINSRIRLSEFSEINGLIIIKNDRLVFENYYELEDPQESNLRTPTLSKRHSIANIDGAGLSFTLAAVGVAVDKRLLSIEDPIMDYLPGYEDVFLDDAEKENITIEHLLLHKSGFSWDTGIRPFSLQNDLNEMKATDDWVRFILEQPMEAPAGLRFNLNTSSGVLLAKIIENASDQSFEAFLKENILDPLAINTLSIETDPSANYNPGDGIDVSLLDWTKLGYLYLKEGLWQGRKIIDPNFIENATTIQTEVSGTYTFGYFWWQFGTVFTNAFGVPYDEIFYMPGELGQHMYIIPSENMIISIFAENLPINFNDPSRNLFAEITYTFQ